MPVDLDELFDAVRRQADTISLAGAGPARQRGRHRDRVRAAVTVAVVVAVVAVGTGLVVGRGPDRQPDRPAGPMVGRPIPVDGRAGTVKFATDGTRAYLAWARGTDLTIWTATVDLTTGAALQAPQRLADASEELENVVVTASVAVVVTKPRVQPSNGLRLYFLDRRTGGPAGGRPIAQAEGSDSGEEDWVVAGDRIVSADPPSQVLVQSIDGTGSQDLDGDYSAARILGWGTAADQNRGTLIGTAATFTDPRAVLVTVDGTAHVIDTRSGRTLRTVGLGVVAGRSMAVFDGTLAMVDPHDSPTGPQRLRFVDLSGGGAGAWESDPIPGAVISMGECGTSRICVVTAGDGPRGQVTAFDVRQRRIAWQTATDFGGDMVLRTVNGRTLVSGPNGYDVYDADGRLITGAKTLVNGTWLTPAQLLLLRFDGTLTRRPLAAGQPEAVSRISSVIYGCTATATRLLCLTDNALQTWKVG